MLGLVLTPLLGPLVGAGSGPGVKTALFERGEWPEGLLAAGTYWIHEQKCPRTWLWENSTQEPVCYNRESEPPSPFGQWKLYKIIVALLKDKQSKNQTLQIQRRGLFYSENRASPGGLEAEFVTAGNKFNANFCVEHPPPMCQWPGPLFPPQKQLYWCLLSPASCFILKLFPTPSNTGGCQCLGWRYPFHYECLVGLPYLLADFQHYGG